MTFRNLAVNLSKMIRIMKFVLVKLMIITFCKSQIIDITYDKIFITLI